MDMDEETYRALKGYEGLAPLDKFGKFLMENLRDEAITFYDSLAVDDWKGLNEGQKDLVRLYTKKAIDHAIHDFLFKLQEQADFENSIQVSVDGVSIVEESEAGLLQAYPLGEDGWQAKYSKFPRTG